MGKVCVLGAKGIKKLIRPVNKDEAVQALRNGEDVLFKRRRDARDAARDAGGRKNPIHEIDRKTGTGHYHPHGRTGGHAIYEKGRNLAVALTVSNYAAGYGRAAEAGAWVLDLVNPLSLPNDIFDVVDELCE